jgi:hypothetical protein
VQVTQKRVGLLDVYGGSMPSGWLRFLLERFEFPFEVVYPPTLDAGNLKSRFDVLILPDGAISQFAGRGGRAGQTVPDSELPAEYRGRQGRVTREATLPKLKDFLEAGGTVIAIGSSSGIAEMMGLGIYNALTEVTPDGRTQALPREKYYVPGSVLQASIDNAHPMGYGMGGTANVFFNNSPVYKLSGEAIAKGARPIAWFSSPDPLRSGWLHGGAYLNGTFAAIALPVGRGSLCVIGPEATFRAQPHGTFKLLFNSIYSGF